jgi:hypothetical protein
VLTGHAILSPTTATTTTISTPTTAAAAAAALIGSRLCVRVTETESRVLQPSVVLPAAAAAAAAAATATTVAAGADAGSKNTSCSNIDLLISRVSLLVI